MCATSEPALPYICLLHLSVDNELAQINTQVHAYPGQHVYVCSPLLLAVLALVNSPVCALPLSRKSKRTVCTCMSECSTQLNHGT